MKRKGISPLIAAVLLIAFTMAVASLFAQWAPQLMEEVQGETQNQSGEIRRCSGLIVDVINGDASNATIQQTSGDQAIGDLSVTWFYDDGSAEQTYANITSRRGTDQANVTDEYDGNRGLDYISVNPLDCEGASPEEYNP